MDIMDSQVRIAAIDTLIEETRKDGEHDQTLGRRVWKVVCILMILYAGTALGFIDGSNVFMQSKPEYQCKRSVGSIYEPAQIKSTKDCTPRPTKPRQSQCFTTDMNSTEVKSCDAGFAFDQSTFVSTIVTEFSLVCERARVAPLISSLYCVSSGIGSILAGYFGDIFGRKRTASLASAVMTLMPVAGAFSSCWQLYIIHRFILILSARLVHTNMFILCIESASSKTSSSILGMVYLICWSIGMIAVSFLAQYLPTWQSISFATGIWCVPVVFFCFLVPESALWEQKQKQIEEARVLEAKRLSRPVQPVFEKIGLEMGMKQPLNGLVTHTVIDCRDLSGSDEDDSSIRFQDFGYESGRDDSLYHGALSRKYNSATDVSVSTNVSSDSSPVQALFSNGRYILVHLAIFTCVTFSSGLLLFCFVFDTKSDVDSIYLTKIISTAADIPACLMVLALLSKKHMPRKKVYWGLLLFCALSGLSLTFIPSASSTGCGKTTSSFSWGMVRSALKALTRFALVASWNFSMTYVAEIFPTPVRCTVTSINQCAGAMGAILSAPLLTLAEIGEWIPMCVCSCLLLISSAMVYFLPETRKISMLSTLGEARTFYKSKAKKMFSL